MQTLNAAGLTADEAETRGAEWPNTDGQRGET